MVICQPVPDLSGRWVAVCTTCEWAAETEETDLRVIVELHESLHMIEIRDAGDA